jgi:hypothetical protein
MQALDGLSPTRHTGEERETMKEEISYQEGSMSIHIRTRDKSHSSRKAKIGGRDGKR